jgi:hypothetical protein
MQQHSLYFIYSSQIMALLNAMHHSDHVPVGRCDIKTESAKCSDVGSDPMTEKNLEHSLKYKLSKITFREA